MLEFIYTIALLFVILLVASFTFAVKIDQMLVAAIKFLFGLALAVLKYFWPALLVGKITGSRSAAIKTAVVCAILIFAILQIPVTPKLVSPDEVAKMEISYETEIIGRNKVRTNIYTSTYAPAFSMVIDGVSNAEYKRSLKELMRPEDWEVPYTVAFYDENDKLLQTWTLYDETYLGVKSGLFRTYYKTKGDTFYNRQPCVDVMDAIDANS